MRATFEQRFDQLLKQVNLTRANLFKQIEYELKKAPIIDNHNQDDFNKMIRGEMEFDTTYIPLIEKYLQTNWLYLLTGFNDYQAWTNETISLIINKNFIKNEEVFSPNFLRLISKVSAIFDLLFKIVPYQKSWLFKEGQYQLTNSENNNDFETIFANPILASISQTLLLSKINNKDQNSSIIKILTFALKFNQTQIENLKKLREHPDLTLDEFGFVADQKQVYGNFILISLNALPDISDDLFKLISEVNHLVDNFAFNKRFLTDGFSASAVYWENNKILKKITNNQNEYRCLKLLNKSNFPYAPIYYGQENDSDVFSYFEGKTSYFAQTMPLSFTIQVAKCLKTMHKICKPKLQNKVYVHDDLSPMNVIFKDQTLRGIIDWDSTKIGEDYEDLIFLCWVWINIGQYPVRDNEQIFKDLLIVVDAYNPSEETKNNFAMKMMTIMTKRLENTSLQAINYDRVKQWVEWSQEWVRLYQERITKYIG